MFVFVINETDICKLRHILSQVLCLVLKYLDAIVYLRLSHMIFLFYFLFWKQYLNFFGIPLRPVLCSWTYSEVRFLLHVEGLTVTLTWRQAIKALFLCLEFSCTCIYEIVVWWIFTPYPFFLFHSDNAS